MKNRVHYHNKMTLVILNRLNPMDILIIDGELSSHTIGVVASMLFDFGVTTVGSMKDGNIIYGKVKKVLLNGKNEQ